MPFAYIDWEHENAFTPPSLTISSASEAGLDAGSESPQGLAGEEASEAGVVLPYQAPPMSESETGFKSQWRQHAGSGDNRKDSVNPYCQYCKAFMATVMAGSADVDGACANFPKTSQATCKVVGKTMEMKEQAIVTLEKGCIDRTGEMPVEKGQKECPPLVACNLMEADNGTPLCGMVLGTWGEFRHVYNANGQIVEEQYEDGNLNTKYPVRDRNEKFPLGDDVAFSPPPELNVIPGASNPYCDLCQDIMSVLQKTPESTPHDACKLVPASLYTECMWVSKPLKKNPDALKIIEVRFLFETLVHGILFETLVHGIVRDHDETVSLTLVCICICIFVFLFLVSCFLFLVSSFFFLLSCFFFFPNRSDAKITRGKKLKMQSRVQMRSHAT
jgi:hypothetical protein